MNKKNIKRKVIEKLFDLSCGELSGFSPCCQIYFIFKPRWFDGILDKYLSRNPDGIYTSHIRCPLHRILTAQIYFYCKKCDWQQCEIDMCNICGGNDMIQCTFENFPTTTDRAAFEKSRMVCRKPLIDMGILKE